MLLSQINAHPSDSRIAFRDEGHIYWIDGSTKDLVSATTFIHGFFNEFNTDKTIKNILLNSKHKTDKSYVYYMMTYDEIKNKWSSNAQNSSSLGTLMHANIEKFYNNIKVEDSTEEFKQFLCFFNDHKHLTMYRTEWLVFSEIFRITGSIDAVFKNVDGTITIGDWKRSKKISMTSFGNKPTFGIIPFDNLQDCNFYHYSLQLNLYRILLETFYDQTVTDMFLVVCHPDNDNNEYIKYPVKRMQKEAVNLLKERAKQLVNIGYEKQQYIDFFETNGFNDVINNVIDDKIKVDYVSDDDDIPTVRLLRVTKEPIEETNVEPIVESIVEPIVEPIEESIEEPIEESIEESTIVEFNKGKRWVKIDDEKLIDCAIKKHSLDKIAKLLGRSSSSIRTRMIMLISNNLKNIEDKDCYIKKFCQISSKDIKEYQTKKEKEVKVKKEKEVKEEKVNETKELKDHRPIVLDIHQQEAFDAMISRKNVFITSPAGCGKTAIIKKFYNEYKNDRKIVVTSTTGTSAILIGGVTLHSYLGIGLGQADVDNLYSRIMTMKFYRDRWLLLDTLIIDEVSMLSPVLFDKLEQLGRKIRRNFRPFGGIQIVLSGDFLQLPCVGESSFCFESTSWGTVIHKTIYLHKIHRQTDKIFQQILNEARVGELSMESINILKTCEDKKVDTLDILPTKIYAVNSSVDFENQKALDELHQKDHDLVFYEYERKININKKNYKLNEKNIAMPETLQLCKGAQVMLLYNMDLSKSLANGSRGVVIDFNKDLPIVRFMNGLEMTIDYYSQTIEENDEKVYTIKQIPLKVAFACSIHKLQGQTLDYVNIDFSNVFETGQSYVALSRVKSLNGLIVNNFDESYVFANEKCKLYYENLKK